MVINMVEEISGTERILMNGLNKLDGKLDSAVKTISAIDKNFSLYAQRNESEHKQINNRIKNLEANDKKTYMLWQTFLNSPIVAKVIVTIVFLIVVGGSGVSLVTLLGLI